MPLAWISLTLSCHSSLSSITFGRSSRLYPVSVQNCCRWVLAVHTCEGVIRRMSLMSLSLLLHQSPACFVHLIWMVLEMGGRWWYSCCFVRCCFQDLFNIAHSILVQLLSGFFSIRLVSVHVVHPYVNLLKVYWMWHHLLIKWQPSEISRLLHIPQ